MLHNVQYAKQIKRILSEGSLVRSLSQTHTPHDRHTTPTSQQDAAKKPVSARFAVKKKKSQKFQLWRTEFSPIMSLPPSTESETATLTMGSLKTDSSVLEVAREAKEDRGGWMTASV